MVDSILKKITILYKNQVISEEDVINNYYTFLRKGVQTDEHNVLFTLHTGSICFDIVTLVWTAISNILSSKESQLDVLRDLSQGDDVVYSRGLADKSKRLRCRFEGFSDEKGNVVTNGHYVLLTQNGGRLIIPVNLASRIQPCNSRAKSLGSKGLKKANNRRIKFLAQFLGKPESEILNVIRLTTIVVMPKYYSDKLIKNITLVCNGVTIRLTELVPVSYYTDVDTELSYGDNSMHVEPVLKIVSNIEVARDFILQKIGNRIVGLIVLGNDVILRSESSLPQLISKKSLNYSLVCGKISSMDLCSMLKSYEDAQLFACTGMYLQGINCECVIRNDYTSILSRQLKGIKANNYVDTTLPNFISDEQYALFRKKLFRLLKSEYDWEEKGNFIVQAFSMMNLFMTAVFSMDYLKSHLNFLRTDSLQNRLEGIRKIACMAPGDVETIKADMENIVCILEAVYTALEKKSCKGNELKRLLVQKVNSSIGVIVPKKYYEDIIHCYISEYQWENVKIMTKADLVRQNDYYDVLIDVGMFSEYDKYNIFLCNNVASEIITLNYELERYKVRRAQQAVLKLNSYYNSRMGLEDVLLFEKVSSEQRGEDASLFVNTESIDDMLLKYVNQKAWKTGWDKNTQGKSTSVSDISVVAIFENDEVGYFTQNYVAYVYDNVLSEIREKKVRELCEGDTIVFTRSNKSSVDVVDVIFNKMLLEHRFSEEVLEQYNASKLWKLALQRYAESTGESVRKIAKDMFKAKAPVQENTILSWFSEESHTVGPGDIKSVKFIADFTRDDNLCDRVQQCFDSCNQIRKIRMRILRLMGEAILSKLGHRVNEEDIIYRSIQDNVDNLARILTIDSIQLVHSSMPTNLVNRPLSRI